MRFVIQQCKNMSSKFKIEYYHKLPQNTSPYLQLLQAKKKIFGYKYQLIRSTDNPKHSTSTHHNKSIGHTAPSHKHSKTQSNQKPRSQKQHSRKKRSHTQQAQQRMHQSLFLNREGAQHQKQSKHQATKSLFNVEGNIDHSINPNEFMRNYRNMLEQENPKSLTQQFEPKTKKIYQGPSSHSLDKLEITEIDELITLIDNCVEEANDYISYLTDKIQLLKGENNNIKEEQIKLIKVKFEIMQMKDGIINQKENQIDRLKKIVYSQEKGNNQHEKTFEIKKLLQVINKVTEENNTLKLRLKQFSQPVNKQCSQKEKKDIYNSIHNKIDILNISIDKKNQENPQHQLQQEPLRDTRKHKNKQPRFYK